VPVVLLEHELPTNRFAKVVADNFGAACKMTRHLIDQGHRRIAFAFHPFQERDLVGRERLGGFNQAMADAGLGKKAVLLLDACEFGERQTLHYHREKIADCFSRPDRPTALFAGMDMLAIHAMETLREMGLRIPRDVAVAGFDNIEFSQFTQPPLTTMQQPTEEMGRLAAEILFDRIEGKAGLRNKAVCRRLPCQLVIRQSCGASLPSKTPMKTIVQISLDIITIPEALDTARLAIRSGVDWLEAGTPLIIAEGMNGVRALRAEFPKIPIVADLKTMDGGWLEAEMMAKAGATHVVVMERAHP
jgi:hypothetical protein